MSDKASLMLQPAPLAAVGLQREIAALFVQALNLEVPADEIDPDAPLYGEGLGLDSIDSLELIVLLNREYGIVIKDLKEGRKVLVDVNTMVDYIEKNRTK